MDTNEDEECVGAFARARVTIDVTHPLKKIIFIKSENEMKIPITILFERLLDFYFCFGMLGHQYRKRLKYKKDNQKKSFHSRLDESSYAY